MTYLCHYTCRGIFRIIQIIADSRGGPLCTTFQRSPDTGFNTLLSRWCTDRSSKVSGQTIGIPQTPVLGPSPRPIAMLIGHRASKKTFLWVFVLPPRVPCKRPISPAPHRTIFLMLVFVSLNKKLIGWNLRGCLERSSIVDPFIRPSTYGKRKHYFIESPVVHSYLWMETFTCASSLVSRHQDTMVVFFGFFGYRCCIRNNRKKVNLICFQANFLVNLILNLTSRVR